MSDHNNICRCEENQHFLNTLVDRKNKSKQQRASKAVIVALTQAINSLADYEEVIKSREDALKVNRIGPNLARLFYEGRGAEKARKRHEREDENQPPELAPLKGNTRHVQDHNRVEVAKSEYIPIARKGSYSVLIALKIESNKQLVGTMFQFKDIYETFQEICTVSDFLFGKVKE
eukprot:TRINITY_DN33092_c0_g4_i2.p1 TRINITY_DN33092_c0_g4~~TRINITY_DN33092_c0_g4_i2.p1  ORF type:complete len:175 (-),score=25.11 TRINITY_DN33092_c0_g4_i2:75-599(-)